MEFCERHRNEIVYVYGATEPGPLHLNIWYTDAGQSRIDQLIEELMAMMGTDEEASGTSAAGE